MRERASASRVRPLRPDEVAWLTAPLCGALLLASFALVSSRLGSAFFAPRSERFWAEAEVLPEPTEHARYALALLVVPLAVAAVVASRRWPVRMRPATARVVVGASQLALVVALAASLLAQRAIFLHLHVFSPLPGNGQALFDLRTLGAAAVLAVALGVALPRPAVAARLGVLGRETRAARLACGLIALLLVAVWLLPAVNTEGTIGASPVHHLIPWQMSEAFAVLDGRTPLVDFHSQYAQLLPYPTAAVLRVVDPSLGVWVATMIAFSALALLAVFALLRRVARGSLLGLTLFAPFLAAGAFTVAGIIQPISIFSLWPMRYAGPLVLAWLTARHLDAAAPRRRALLLGAGGLVALNNLEFGLPALGGTIAALVAADPPRSRHALGRLALDLAVGVLGAVAVVSLGTLLRAGALPRFGLLLEFPRIYGVGGWVMEPMPTVGFHLVIYVTFAAALAVAAVRAVRREEPLLTGMLAWSGVFGLGASSYWVGRSDQLNLVSLFGAWSLALTLLTLATLRSVWASGRRPGAGRLAVLFCWGLTVCALAQVPRPWDELDRLDRTRAPIFAQRDAVALVGAATRPHEPVAILAPLAHRVAYDAGTVNVTPYASAESMPTAEQLDTTLAAIARDGAALVLIDRRSTYPQLYEALVAAGYRQRAERGRYELLTNAPTGP